MQTSNSKRDDRDPSVAEIHRQLQSAGFSISQAEVEEGLFGASTESAVEQIQGRNFVEVSGVADSETHAAINHESALYNLQANYTHSIAGRVFVEHGMPARGLELKFINLSSGGDLDGEGLRTTDQDGFYRFAYNGEISEMPLEIVARYTIQPEEEGGEEEIAEMVISQLGYVASKHAVLHLTVPSRVQPLKPEYTRLRKDVLAEIDGGGSDEEKLAQQREDQSARDITALHQKTRWDARLIALLVEAHRLAAEDEFFKGVGTPELLYGLFRTGISTNKERFQQHTVAGLDNALARAKAQGIVPASVALEVGAKERIALASTEARKRWLPPADFRRLLSWSRSCSQRRTPNSRTHWRRRS